MKLEALIEQLPRWQPAYDNSDEAVDMVRTDDGDFVALVDLRALMDGRGLKPIPAQGAEFYKGGYARTE